ncbi:hypothetical protein V9T40_001746 [Parthenolecanium corni]|uniref:Uncharacterized protein n=1 Tax=Parthenolecanium corni TaxID=536013 RepID=A0AAN9Y4X0_9HEMI
MVADAKKSFSTRLGWYGRRATLSAAGWNVRSAPYGLLTTCIQFYPQSFGRPVAFERSRSMNRFTCMYGYLDERSVIVPRFYFIVFDGYYILAICHVRRESIASVESDFQRTEELDE